MTLLNIINTGLVLVGDRPLQSLDENSDTSKLVKQIWHQVEQTVLRSATFTSATKRGELALLPDVPPFQYQHTYAQPADCIRILECYEGSQYNKYLEWRPEGKYILANTTPLFIRYTFKPTDEGEYDALLCRALSLRLACDIAYQQTEKRTLVLDLGIEYERILADASSQDSLQLQERYSLEEVPWLDGRFNIGV